MDVGELCQGRARLAPGLQRAVADGQEQRRGRRLRAHTVCPQRREDWRRRPRRRLRLLHVEGHDEPGRRPRDAWHHALDDLPRVADEDCRRRQGQGRHARAGVGRLPLLLLGRQDYAGRAPRPGRQVHRADRQRTGGKPARGRRRPLDGLQLPDGAAGPAAGRQLHRHDHGHERAVRELRPGQVLRHTLRQARDGQRRQSGPDPLQRHRGAAGSSPLRPVAEGAGHPGRLHQRAHRPEPLARRH